MYCDSEGFVRFGDVARYFLNQQAQYASRYIDGKIDGYPNLGHDLRFSGRKAIIIMLLEYIRTISKNY